MHHHLFPIYRLTLPTNPAQPSLPAAKNNQASPAGIILPRAQVFIKNVSPLACDIAKLVPRSGIIPRAVPELVLGALWLPSLHAAVTRGAPVLVCCWIGLDSLPIVGVSGVVADAAPRFCAGG